VFFEANLLWFVLPTTLWLKLLSGSNEQKEKIAPHPIFEAILELILDHFGTVNKNGGLCFGHTCTTLLAAYGRR
jgi:hypothetical protein